MRGSRRLLALCVAACAASAALGQVYVEGVNDELSVDDRWTATGGHEQAFRWTPRNSFDLIQILWHCSPISSGVIRIREDTGGQPGATVREVEFSSGQAGWNGAAFENAYPVVAGNTYFVSFQSRTHDYTKFIAVEDPSGVVLTYYWTPDNGQSWNGPFTFAGRRMIQFFEPGGGCDPCDTNCDGTVDAFDIEPFIDLLLGGPRPCAPCAGDANGDGTVDAFDIEPFIECLFP